MVLLGRGCTQGRLARTARLTRGDTIELTGGKIDDQTRRVPDNSPLKRVKSVWTDFTRLALSLTEAKLGGLAGGTFYGKRTISAAFAAQVGRVSQPPPDPMPMLSLHRPTLAIQ